MKEWRDLWPGGLSDEQYSTLNLMALCREGSLGYNCAICNDCKHQEWYPSSCGDRHCPNCLGPRQAKWSESVCERLPDCPHFHVVFTIPEQLHDFFEANYRLASRLFFEAAAETLKKFQKTNWKMEGGFLGVLHTWGQTLNWHPHLHMLVSSGGKDVKSQRWKEAKSNYLFPVKLMSKVFRGIMVRRIEELDSDPKVSWPEEASTVEDRRDWRLSLARRTWNIYSKPTLGNTRAVVRYLARYTSRIAISNQRLTRIDPVERTVTFRWKNYRKKGKVGEMKLEGQKFLRRFTRHLVPKGLRRIRYYGLLAGKKGRFKDIADAVQRSIGERAIEHRCPKCKRCEGQDWRYVAFYNTETRHAIAGKLHPCAATPSVSTVKSFSLPPP